MKIYQRSMQIWSLLICAARERRTYTYEGISSILGMQNARGIGGFLKPIMRFCEYEGYPALTVLVVKKTVGVPGEGLTTVEEVNKDREKAFDFDWFAIEPPETLHFQNSDYDND